MIVLLIYGCNSFAANQYAENEQGFAFSVEKNYFKNLCYTRCNNYFVEYSNGYAINNEEWVPGLIAIAAPVMDNYAGKAIGAVCFDFSTINNSVTEIKDKFANLAIKLAGNISRLVALHGK
jgi:transcriptional regulator